MDDPVSMSVNFTVIVVKVMGSTFTQTARYSMANGRRGIKMGPGRSCFPTPTSWRGPGPKEDAMGSLSFSTPTEMYFPPILTSVNDLMNGLKSHNIFHIKIIKWTTKLCVMINSLLDNLMIKHDFSFLK